MDEFEQHLHVPKQRVAVIIGTNGETKRGLESRTRTKIKISSEGEITINSADSFDAWIAKTILKAIGRGFSPEHALLLLNDEYGFDFIEIKDWANTEKAMTRLKGRVIGEKGTSRETIEELTEGYISVFGKTICIIAKNLRLPVVRRAIEMLLGGSRHSTVYRMLEKERAEWRKEEIMYRAGIKGEE
jgi:ribosomal RNA assembly protein